MAKSKNTDQLTDKQKRFCDEYIIDLNATQAAIRAGYSEKSARITASKMLANVSLQDYIHEARQKLDKRIENKYLIDKDKVLKEYARTAFSDIRVYFDENGNLKNFADLTEDEASALSSVEIEEIKGPFNTILGHTKKIKVYDKLRALDGIAKIMGYNAPEKKELTGSNGEPLMPKRVRIDVKKLTTEELKALAKVARNADRT